MNWLFHGFSLLPRIFQGFLGWQGAGPPGLAEVCTPPVAQTNSTVSEDPQAVWVQMLNGPIDSMVRVYLPYIYHDLPTKLVHF